MSDKSKRSHLDEVEEWQKHQFDPDHYTGGNIHPYVKAPGKPMLAAVWWFAVAGIWLFFYYLFVIRSNLDGNGITCTFGDIRFDSTTSFIMLTVLFVGIALFNVWLGIRYCVKAKQKKERYRRMRRHAHAGRKRKR